MVRGAGWDRSPYSRAGRRLPRGSLGVQRGEDGPPTAAAELAVPVLVDVLDDIAGHAGGLQRALAHRVEVGRKALQALEQRTSLRDPAEYLRRREQQLDEIAERLRAQLRQHLHHHHRRLSRAEVLVQHLHPRTGVARGTALLVQRAHRLRWSVSRRAVRARQCLQSATSRLLARSPARRLDRQQARLEGTLRRLTESVHHRGELLGERLASTAGKLEAMSHRATQARGFSITRLKKNRAILSEVVKLAPGDRLLTEVITGEIESAVVDSRQLELVD